MSLLAALVVGMLSVCLSSCGDDPEPPFIKVAQPSVNFEASGGSTSVAVQSNTSWNITGMPSWLTVAPSTGNGNGTFSITANPNTDQARNCTLYLTAGDATATVTVYQQGKGIVSLADQVSGTYSGRLTLGEEVLEDAYIVRVTKLTDNTVAVKANFFGDDDMNFNLIQSGSQIAFSNATLSNFSMYALGNTLVINYLSNGGNMLTYTGTK